MKEIFPMRTPAVVPPSRVKRGPGRVFPALSRTPIHLSSLFIFSSGFGAVIPIRFHVRKNVSPGSTVLGNIRGKILCQQIFYHQATFLKYIYPYATFASGLAGGIRRVRKVRAGSYRCAGVRQPRTCTFCNETGRRHGVGPGGVQAFKGKRWTGGSRGWASGIRSKSGILGFRSRVSSTGAKGASEGRWGAVSSGYDR